ncbi:hypothetical protein D3C77_244400 [compost metagenome]
MLTREGMPPIHDGFCGAIISGKLVDLSDCRKRRFCRALGAILLKIGIRFPSIQGDTWLPFPFTKSLMQWKEERIQFAPETLAYWDGWTVENKRDRVQYVHLAKLYQTHGKEFVDELHSGIQRHLESRADVVNNGYDRIVNFLVAKPDEWPATTFKHPIKIYDFFKALIRVTFKDKKPRARSTIDLGYRWDRHIGEIERTFILPRTWAQPYRPLPLTGLKMLRGRDTHITETDHGTVVKTKLITPIPLHVTQAEAMHILAHKISADVAIVREWATRRMQEVMKAFHHRKALAKEATDKDFTNPKFWVSDPIANIAGLFEDSPYAIDWRKILRRYQTCNKSRLAGENASADLARKIGVPSVKDIYPFQCALVLEHPLITDSFLKNFELYDINGNMSGIVEEGGKSYLAYEKLTPDIVMSGSKHRKGKNRSRQTFELSPTARKIIDDLILLTKQGSDYLRSVGDDNWRKLFIASSRGITQPRPIPTVRWDKSQIKRIKKATPRFILEIGAVMRGSTREEIIELVSNVTLSSIRASRCVEIYLLTGKTDLMRQALGHDASDSKVLESYLPEVFIRLIESRSIQVVQKIIICHSLRDSPFLVKGASFETLEELEIFLENYTSQELPTYLTNPEGIEALQILKQADELFVRIGLGSLVALLSLRDAANSIDDHRIMPASLLKWAEIADLVEQNIELGNERSLKRKLAEAKSMTNPEPFLRSFREKR